MEPVTVLVTAVGGGGLGEQLIKALRLASTPYRIIGTDMSAFSKGLAEVDQAERVPPARDADFVPTLLDLCRRHGARAVLCGSEAEIAVLDQHREQFAAAGLFLPIQPGAVLDTCLDKVKTAAFLAAHGFHTPAYARITSRQELDAFPHLPAVVKPSRGGGGSANLFLAQTRDELIFFGDYLLRQYQEFIVQEYVGTPQTEFTAGVLLDMEGHLWNSIAVRRNILTALSNRLREPNRTGRAGLGPVLAISNGVSQGEIGPFPEVCAECERIALALGARGAINIQCRVDSGRVYVFEINPRFSGTTSLRAMVGYNEPDLLIRRHVLGQEIAPRFSYRSGTILRGLSETFLEG